MSSTLHDYLVLGAGPAGLQMGYCLKRADRDFLILEAGERAGAFFETFPRHGVLISSNKVYTGYDDPEINLRFDWNSLLCDDPELLFKNYSREYFPPREALLRYLGDFAERFRLPIEYGARIAQIRRSGQLAAEDGFEVEDGLGRTWRSRRLIVATGLTKPFLPPIPGIELTETYFDMPVDPEEFAGQRVLIIGKGNSGFETADNLIATTTLLHIASPNPLQMAWKTHFPGHLRAVNNNLLDTYQLKTQNAVLDGTIKRITKLEDGTFLVSIHYTHAEEEHEDLCYDRVLTCTGFRFDDSIFDAGCRPAMWAQNRLPEQTSEFESTTVPGLYFAGTLMQMRDYKKATSAFIHGFRYNVRSLHHILAAKHHQIPWPSERLPSSSAADLTEFLLERINRTSALWQLFGFLCDVLILEEDRGVRYCRELPVQYVLDSDLSRHRTYFMITLEFGKIDGDPFNILRNPNPAHAERSTFLHPVVRRYRGKEKVAELHLLENLLGEWRDPQLHQRPLLDFLSQTTQT